MVLPKYPYGLGDKVWMVEEGFSNGGNLLGPGCISWKAEKGVRILCYCRMVNLGPEELTEVQ